MPAGGGIGKVGLTLCRAAAYTAISGAFVACTQ